VISAFSATRVGALDAANIAQHSHYQPSFPSWYYKYKNHSLWGASSASILSEINTMVKTMSKTSIQYSNPPLPPPPCYSAVQPGYQCHSQEPMHKVSFPPSLTQPQGLVSIDAEWEENSFFSTKRMRHHETWSVSTDPNTHAIIADYTAKYDSNPHQEASSEIDTKLLPHYYTIHSVNLDEGRSRQPIINFFAWTERNNSMRANSCWDPRDRLQQKEY
jgi:hypothetical protein